MFLVFFKQKTAYEMRISDWSADVCSSDLSLRDIRPDRRALECLVAVAELVMDRIVQEDRVFIAPCFPVVIEALDQAPATLLINIDRRQKCARRVHAVFEAVDPLQKHDW